jgi:hypothetical protein
LIITHANQIEMDNARAFKAFALQELSNGVLGAQFGACLTFQPKL